LSILHIETYHLSIKFSQRHKSNQSIVISRTTVVDTVKDFILQNYKYGASNRKIEVAHFDIISLSIDFALSFARFHFLSFHSYPKVHPKTIEKRIDVRRKMDKSFARKILQVIRKLKKNKRKVKSNID